VQNYLHRLDQGYSIDNDFVPSKLDRAKQITPPWIEAVREQFGTSDTKWVTVGYCFGAPFVVDLLAEDWVLSHLRITTGAFAHPAILNEDHFYNLKLPLLLSCSGVDHTFPLEFRHRAEDILIEIKATYHIQLFSGLSHGFALRGNLDDPVAHKSIYLVNPVLWPILIPGLGQNGRRSRARRQSRAGSICSARRRISPGCKSCS